MKRLDCVGLQCPLPGYNTRKALDGIQAGEILEVTTDGKAGRSDVPAMARRLGHKVLGVEELDGVFVYRIMKR